ncbi:tigger transposable element-derived protein 1 [Trichonephila clavipes]|nr:tigger transposable element-derived protein 1 [Trichonephila clavipes]
MEKKNTSKTVNFALETKIATLDRLGKGEGSMERESATADEGAAKIFPEELAKIIDGDYSADQVFNADETGLYWKKLPNRTYITKNCKWTYKESKDRVTLLLCRNASGDRMLKPLLINKSLRPRALKGDGFNTFNHHDIHELLVDDALSDNDIIDLTLDLYITVDGVVGLEGDNDEDEKSTPLTGKLIQGLQLCSKLENHFLSNDPNSERASKLQRELQNCMSGYRELYKKIKESSSQSLISDDIVRKGRAAQNENEVCENPWPLPQISIAEAVSSDGDLEPLRKRCKPLSDSDND